MKRKGRGVNMESAAPIKVQKPSTSVSVRINNFQLPFPNAMKTSSTPPFSFCLSLFAAAALLFAVAAKDTSAPATNPDGSTKAVEFIRTRCNATMYPELCYTSLSVYANSIQQSPAHLARVAVSVSLDKARNMTSYVANLCHRSSYGTPPRTAAALHDCFSTFSDAIDQIRGSLRQMRKMKSGESFRFQMSNVQTWMSAALTNEETCTDGFEDVPDGAVKSEVCDRAGNVKKFTSNALALVNSYIDQETNSEETP